MRDKSSCVAIALEVNRVCAGAPCAWNKLSCAGNVGCLSIALYTRSRVGSANATKVLRETHYQPDPAVVVRPVPLPRGVWIGRWWLYGPHHLDSW